MPKISRDFEKARKFRLAVETHGVDFPLLHSIRPKFPDHIIIGKTETPKQPFKADPTIRTRRVPHTPKGQGPRKTFSPN